ncbi:NEAT domain-containing protein [Secundilactobacillus kimchicus]|uniref:NEAT domain-containing protein n=1 Tax=Secundilactobacillus kimchicus TaxID=528209 RepID=UPI0006E2A461|nr:NEAT domain-containing protein [Secundilactobacillus kimchicus]
MKHQSWIKWLLGVAAIAAIAMTAGLSQKASAASLSDGTYTLPVKLLKKGSTSTSMANMYFVQTGKAVVSGSNATVTVTTNGANYIKKMTANGAGVTESNQSGNNADLSFYVNGQATLVPVGFALQIGPMSMNQTAQFKLDWLMLN